MFQIKDLLARFQHLTLPNETARREAVVVINKLTGLKLEIGQVKINRQGELLVEGSPAIKSVIYIHRRKIEAALRSSLGPQAPLRVR